MLAYRRRLEHGVYNLSRMRESATEKYRGFHIPTNWMSDTGYVTQVISSSYVVDNFIYFMTLLRLWWQAKDSCINLLQSDSILICK